MAKPPTSPPSSDLDGVDRDEVSNVDAAIESGQDGEDLERARKNSVGKPTGGERDPKGNRDDRSG